jgi:hypothetical protein
MIRIVSSIFAATLLTLNLGAGPAQAQSRVFVAAQGSDSNSCTFALPCRTFQHAHNVVAANGEIDVLDPAGYGGLSITKSISIQGHGFSGVSVASGGIGIVINGANIVVNLNGLLIEGAGVGATGIAFIGGGVLKVQNCVVRNLTGNGILFVPTSSGDFSVSDTFVGNNGAHGILVQPTSSASVTAVFNRVEAQYNGANAYGIRIDATLTSGTIQATATDTVSSNNGGGFHVQAAVQGRASLMLVRCVAAYNHTGVQAGDFAAGAAEGTILISQVAITSNVVGWNSNHDPGSTDGFFSYGDNTIGLNGANNSAPSFIPKG